MSASFGVKRLRHVGSAPRVFALKTLVTQKLYRKMIPYAATYIYICVLYIYIYILCFTKCIINVFQRIGNCVQSGWWWLMTDVMFVADSSEVAFPLSQQQQLEPQIGPLEWLGISPHFPISHVSTSLRNHRPPCFDLLGIGRSLKFWTPWSYLRVFGYKMLQVSWYLHESVYPMYLFPLKVCEYHCNSLLVWPLSAWPAWHLTASYSVSQHFSIQMQGTKAATTVVCLPYLGHLKLQSRTIGVSLDGVERLKETDLQWLKKHWETVPYSST